MEKPRSEKLIEATVTIEQAIEGMEYKDKCRVLRIISERIEYDQQMLMKREYEQNHIAKSANELGPSVRPLRPQF